MNSGLPTVSVVIPTHNPSVLLRRTLRSVLGQTGVDLDVVIVDDGSADGTADLIAGLADPRVRLERNPVPCGVSRARNRGIAAARGDWVAFLDDDDLWAPDKLSSQVAAAESSERDWCYAGTVAVSPSLEVLAGGPPPQPAEVSRWLPWRNMVRDGASNVLVRRELLQRTGGFDASLRHMSDWDLWIRLGQAGPPAAVERPLVAYLIHPGNASADTGEIPAELSVLDRRYRHLRGGAAADRGYVHRWIAWNSLRTGKRGEAVRAYWRAVRGGDAKSLARMLVALLAPGVARRGYGRGEAEPAWKEAAEAWLQPLRTSQPDADEATAAMTLLR
jgi:glycosyltransferase involved in cell wall biosynthesis